MPGKPKSVTHRINETALALLDKHPEGIRWTDLNKMIEATDASFHPKTVNVRHGGFAKNSPIRSPSRRKGSSGW